MGFFSSSKPKYSDKVWKSSAFCLKGMVTDALQLITQNEAPVIASQFPEGQEKIVQFLSSNQVPYFLVDPTNTDEAWHQSQVVYVLNWKFIKPSEAIDFLTRLLKKSKVHLFFFGHYPLPSKENRILDQFSVIQLPLPVTFFSSLDEPSFEIFGASQIISIMDKMGMKDEEPVEHAMVAKAMERARQKIEDKVKFDHEANSEKEWFQKNVRQG
ncbi:hypothetical protein WSM22_11090 [Cytophagales bacterium WSM2-2]|nr:hypothetical protein WSM22_11090 [Cytophagales bacterium WSM2-2]